MEVVAQTANAPNAESFWAGLQEIRDILKESTIQFNRRIGHLDNSIKETDRIIKESSIQFNRRIGHLDNNFGELAEFMIAPKICEKFREFGLDLPRANPTVAINDRKNQIFLEIDIMLENGDKAVLIEVKAKLTKERINSHIERLEKMRRYSDLHGDKRAFLGAVAGVALNDAVKNYALEQGLYLIEPSGDSFYITAPNGTPKEW